MRAALIFTNTGPILALTSLERFDDPGLIARLAAKGIAKYLAYEIPLDEVRGWYGPSYDAVLTDRAQEDELRILDIDGPHIFCHLRLSSLGPAIRCEATPTGVGP
jgi:hypothetical protein